MPLFSPSQIQQYAQSADSGAQMPGIPSRVTVQPGVQPNPIPGQQSSLQPDKPGLPWGYKAGLVGANLFDAGTTRAAASKGAIESNPLMAPFAGSTPGFMIAKGALGLAQAYAMNKLAKAHPKAARIMSGIEMGIPAAAGLANLSKVR